MPKEDMNVVRPQSRMAKGGVKAKGLTLFGRFL